MNGYPGNITITGAKNYEVSSDNSNFATSILVPFTSATLSAKTIYVRLKSGLAVGSYNSSLISNSGGGASSITVTCSGTVTNQPSLTIGTSTLSDFISVFGKGASESQSFSVRGSYLASYPGNILVSAPSNYEVSTNNSTFSSSVNIA